jgi:methionyl-tRNA formyltransferase
VLASRATAIGEEENAGELAARLAGLGAELLVEVIEALELGTAVALPQDERLATLAPKLVGMRELDLGEPAEEVARAVRAHTPEPGARLAVRVERLKVLAARAVSAPRAAEPGEVLGVEGDALHLGAGGGSCLALLRAQRPGGRPISGRDLANGLRLAPGDRLD